MAVADMSLSIRPVLKTPRTDGAFKQEAKVLFCHVKAQFSFTVLVSLHTEVAAPLVSSSLVIVVKSPGPHHPGLVLLAGLLPVVVDADYRDGVLHFYMPQVCHSYVMIHQDHVRISSSGIKCQS